MSAKHSKAEDKLSTIYFEIPNLYFSFSKVPNSFKS